jgi:oligopeptide transport system substrate-binding protein
MKSKKWLWMFVLALTFVLAACGGFTDDASDDSSTDSTDNEQTNSDTGTTGGEKVLKLSLENDIPDLNQVLTTDGISFQVLNNVMEGLYRLDPNNEPQPASAESVNISDDKLTYTFKLREGLKWSDGSDLTAENYRYSWLRAIHPDTAGAYADIIYSNIVGGTEYNAGEADADAVGIKVLDPLTLEVTLVKPTPYFLGLTAFPTYFPLSEEFINKVGDKFALNKDSILYNGPYVLTEFDQAQGVMLEKNDQYWDKANVDIDKVSLKVIKEKSTALNLYESGELDRVYLSSADVSRYSSDPEFGTETEFTSWFLQFNHDVAPFDNVNIRKAFQLSYDAEVLVKTVLNNGSEAATGLVAKGVYGDGTKTFRELSGDVIKPDVEAAKEFLAKGIEEIGGKLPTIEVLTADDTIAKDTATFLQSEFKKNLGVDVSIVTKPYSGRLDAMRASEYMMGISRWGSDYDDAMDILGLWDGDPKKGLRGNYYNPAYKELMNKVLVETDDKKRLEYLIQGERLMLTEDGALGPLYYDGQSFLQKDYLSNLVIHPYGASLNLKYAKLTK